MIQIWKKLQTNHQGIFMGETLGLLLFSIINLVSNARDWGDPLVSIGLYPLLLVFAPFSGAHFNPAVTMAVALHKKIDWGLYLIAQAIGNLGGCIAFNLIWEGLPGGLMTADFSNIDILQYCMAQAFATFLLCFFALCDFQNPLTPIPFIVYTCRLLSPSIRNLNPGMALVFALFRVAVGPDLGYRLIGWKWLAVWTVSPFAGAAGAFLFHKCLKYNELKYQL